MPTNYSVEQGDCLASIAQKFGFQNWRLIYDDPSNAEFKKARPDPNVLQPGDVVVIPEKKLSKKSAPAKPEQRNKYQVTVAKTLLRIKVEDEDEKPLAGKKYELRLGDDVRKGSTDGDGIVEVKVPPALTKAKLLVFDGDQETGPLYVWDVAIGHLDPIESLSGVKARLNNLGYFCGDDMPAPAASDGDDAGAPELDPLTTLAVAGFQEVQGLERTSKLDDATRKKLVEIHGET